MFYRSQGSGKNSTVSIIIVLLLVENRYLEKHYNKLMAYETVRNKKGRKK